jgi:transcriptional regulator with XRE-family HTH domain
MFVRRPWTMTGFPGKLAGMTTQELVQDAPLAAYQAPTTYSEIIRDEVKAECGRRGISQRRLAQAMGLAQQSISERWRGRVPWTLDEVERLETALGLSRGALLFRCARRDSNPQPSDLSPLQVRAAGVDVDAWELAA